MKSLKKYPKRMGWIRHAAVRECIACEYIGELVVYPGRRGVQHRLQRQPQQNRHNSSEYEAQHGPPRDSYDEPLNRLEKLLPELGDNEREAQCEQHGQRF